MVREICLDSDFLIDFFKNKEKAVAIFNSLNANYCLTSINVFELWEGRKKEEKLKEFFEQAEIKNFDYKSALLAAIINSSLKQKGEEIEIRDVFIAAICIEHNLELLTYNIKHFERMEKFGLKLVKL